MKGSVHAAARGYACTNMREKIKEILRAVLKEGGYFEDGAAYGGPLEVFVPEKAEFGHYSTNVAMRIPGGGTPLARAEAIAKAAGAAAPAGFFEKTEAAAPGFVNFWLSPETVRGEFARVAREKRFGRNGSGAGAAAIVEYSSVNIAKPFHLGHLRNTVLGAALANILEANGYRVIRWNYLGDWGTQFGKLIAAYKQWGDRRIVRKNPIEELQKLYVRFHAAAAEDPALEARARDEFRKLESGDRENRKLWEWFKEESLAEFKKTYRALGVDFDAWIGESFFEKELRPLAADLAARGIAERSEGALIVRLDEFNLPPVLIEKSDGASLYLTRDIANLRYRLRKYKPAEILYVVGNEQSLAFAQLFAIAKKLGMDSARLAHVKYGLVLGESGKKISTRRGEAVTAAEAMDKAVALARGVVDEKGRGLTERQKDAAARAVGIGALKYANLKENRLTDIVFDWGKMLDLTGDSAPYLQYTYARFASILRKAPKGAARRVSAGATAATAVVPGSEPELALMRKIFEFPDAVAAAGEMHSTSVVANYLYKLAVASNRFYETTPVLGEEDRARRAARLALVAVAARTLRDGQALLGIESPEKI